MTVTMNARWDDLGVIIPGGQAKYTVDEQPIAEYDNYFNYNIAADMQAVIDDVIDKYNANTILKADSDNTPIALTVAEQTVVGRLTGGSIDALTPAEVRTVINVEDAADVTDATNVNTAGAVMEEDFDAYTILAADTDNTPAALAVDTSRFVGRKAAGGIVAMTAAESEAILTGTFLKDGSRAATGAFDLNGENVDNVGKLILNDQTELTISGGAITVTQSWHSVDNESDDPADDLTTINGHTDGQILILHIASGIRVTTIKSASGNIRLAANADFVMDSQWDTITLIYDGSTTTWIETSRSDNSVP